MWIEHILRLVEILAWPMTVFLVLLLLRNPIGQLIPSIGRIRYKGLDIEFSKELETAEQGIAQSDAGESPDTSGEDTMVKLVEISPATAVLKAWKQVESVAKAKVIELKPEDETFLDPTSRPIEYLDFKGAFIPSVASAARTLCMLQNQAAHTSYEQISRQDALRYLKVARRLQAQIEAITELPSVKLTALMQVILQLNQLIDSKKHEDITIDEVYGWIEKRNVLPALRKRIGNDADLNLFGESGPYYGFTKFYHEKLHNLWDAYGGQHRRKWGIENMGLCLLLAWSNEIIQQGSGWYPAKD